MSNYAKVQKDEVGLYILSGGYFARPIKETHFKENDKIKTHHFSGTIIAGVGKDFSMKKGKYLEYWVATGIGNWEYNSPEKRRKSWEWYKNHYLELHQIFDNKIDLFLPKNRKMYHLACIKHMENHIEQNNI